MGEGFVLVTPPVTAWQPFVEECLRHFIPLALKRATGTFPRRAHSKRGLLTKRVGNSKTHPEAAILPLFANASLFEGGAPKGRREFSPSHCVTAPSKRGLLARI